MDDDATSRPELIAFFTGDAPPLAVEPASRWREWMNATDERSANRCLPLLMANEAGWQIGNPAPFTATWEGEDHPGATTVVYDGEPPRAGRAESHFGYGVVTWGVSMLFRTPPGWNLLARGPANLPVDGASPLEGLVETDWAVATFTMNWKLTRPGLAVRFDAGFPFCVVVPQARAALERFSPAFRSFDAEPELKDKVRAWTKGRHDAQVAKFLSEYSNDFADAWSAWQQHYFRGTYPDGEPAPAHQTKQRLAPFTRAAAPR
jgi:hypothetical protein